MLQLAILYYQSIEPTVLKEAEARQKRILDANYSELDLDDYAHKEMHLSQEQQEKFICSIRTYPKLFRGDLGVAIESTSSTFRITSSK
jgi:hypothetical protein